MNTDMAAEARAQPQPFSAVPPLRRLYWSVRRELWEYRSLYLAPLAVAALGLAGFAIHLVRLPEALRAAAALDPMRRQAALEQPYTFVALLLMLTTTVVGVFYCVEALHAERRDRAILFWKSLPVSDATTVLAKAAVPLVILPLLTFAVTFVTHAIMLSMAGVRLIGAGLGVWSQLGFGQMELDLLSHLVLVHGLWYAPIWGWLLLASAWSRRVPLVWAALPPLALSLVESIAFGTASFAACLGRRLMGGPAGPASGDGPMTMASMTPGTPGQFLASPGFWLGLALTAAFLFAAVRLRRYHGPV